MMNRQGAKDAKFIQINETRWVNIAHVTSFTIRVSELEQDNQPYLEVYIALTVVDLLTPTVYENYVDAFLSAVGNDLTVEQIKADYRANDGE